MNTEKLSNYARLLVRRGLNVQAGQEVLIMAELDQPEFVTQCVSECYAAGAKRVTVEWTHMPLTRVTYLKCAPETLSTLEGWEKERWQWQTHVMPAKLYLDSEDPDGLSSVENYPQIQYARRAAIKPYRDQMENRYQWCIGSVPGKAWAQKMFPGKSVSESEEALWEAILSASRVSADPLSTWSEHNERLRQRSAWLNSLSLRNLHYSSSNGTDFTLGLNPQCVFRGGEAQTLSGICFNPNIPTEEIFTSPQAGVAEGVVYATKPLSWSGSLIENFWVRFENGSAVEVGAEKNEDLLRKMISLDDGASKLGEVALIPHDSPISNSGLLYYNTLFDENASCHLAFGFGCTDCLKGYEEMTLEEIHSRGVNNSLIHVDFMIGAADLNISGQTAAGQTVQIFRNGNWAV